MLKPIVPIKLDKSNGKIILALFRLDNLAYRIQITTIKGCDVEYTSKINSDTQIRGLNFCNFDGI